MRMLLGTVLRTLLREDVAGEPHGRGCVRMLLGSETVLRTLLCEDVAGERVPPRSRTPAFTRLPPPPPAFVCAQF